MHFCGILVLFLLVCGSNANQLPGQPSFNTVLNMFPEFRSLQQQLAELRSNVSILQANMSRQQSTNEVKPAFFATLSETKSLLKNRHFKFDNVTTNVGSGYNPTTGHFTAPKSGLYKFSVNIVKHAASNQWLEFSLMKRNSIMAKGHCSRNPYTSGTITAILQLLKDDYIYVKNTGEKAQIHGYKFCMFSGSLIQ